jgi:hypothetical protein
MLTDLTPLETELLQRIHSRYASIGFPPVSAFRVRRRESTGKGWRTFLEHKGTLAIDPRLTGELAQGDYSQFDMEGLEAGANFEARVENKKVDYLAIIINGEHPWDGIERAWVVCDPDTGAIRTT